MLKELNMENKARRSSARNKLHEKRSLSSSWLTFLESLRTTFPGGLDTLEALEALDPLDGGFSKALSCFVSNLHPSASIDDCSVSASAFLFRKTIPVPGSKRSAEKDFLERMSKEGSFAGNRWLSVAEEVVDTLFSLGWDKEYLRNSQLCRANLSATLNGEGESARWAVEEDLTELEFWEACVDGSVRTLNPSRRVVAINDSGKWRVVTIADALQCQLLPLHITIYDVLKRHRWLLWGEASRAKVSEVLGSAVRQVSDVFVSGDYERATDGFVPENSKALIYLLQERSLYVPSEIWSMALGRFDEGPLNVKSGASSIRRMGQLMGDYLSFPLLCLTNFVGFIFALGPRGWEIADRGFLLINGDDIVFAASEPEAEMWMDSVQNAGLTLSRGKTLVHRSFFSINSTFFIGCGTGKSAGKRFRTYHVPVIRWKTWTSSSESLGSKMDRILVDLGRKAQTGLRALSTAWFGRVRKLGMPIELAEQIEKYGNKYHGCLPREWMDRKQYWNRWRGIFRSVGDDSVRAEGYGEWVRTDERARRSLVGGLAKRWGPAVEQSAGWGTSPATLPDRPRKSSESWKRVLPETKLLSHGAGLLHRMYTKNSPDPSLDEKGWNSYISGAAKVTVRFTVEGCGLGASRDVEKILVPGGRRLPERCSVFVRGRHK